MPFSWPAMPRLAWQLAVCCDSVPCAPARWPDRLTSVPVLQVLTMPPADVAARLVLLKELLPDSDVARMVELAPE